MAFVEMFELQKKLNDETNGVNWELGITKNKKEINWLRCIHMELAELIDSTPWKHWKNIDLEADLENIAIELVDIWHFIMSFLLQEKNIPKAVLLTQTNFVTNYIVEQNINYKEIIIEAEKLLYITLDLEINNHTHDEVMTKLINQFFTCCRVSGLTFNRLNRLYLGKNCLNQFRQDNGYKDGTYIKVWNGQEDNIYLMNIIDVDTDIHLSFNDIYSELDKVYSNLK
jgi:dimeric dUTPase (all-alpha-NTP-PPase superfamily)